jgi:hypothetical protein
MHKSLLSILSILLSLALVCGCANIIPPTGGKTDTTTPQLLNIKPHDSLLNTRVNRIEMRFNEYVSIGDAAKEITVSPILAQNPSIIAIGKTVILKIEDSLLQKNTTYTLSFGKAIKDLHEGNFYSGPSYVFSTGAWFDSLTIKGHIMYAAKGRLDSSGGIKVLLYDATDSFDVVSKKKPLYLTVANSKGEFNLKGLPNRSFRIFALKETSENLKFDNDDEYVGFTDLVYNPALDTLPITINIFKEIPDTSRLKRDSIPVPEPKRKSKIVAAESKKASAIPSLDAKTFNYSALIDTTALAKRSQDITEPISVFFSRPLDTFYADRIALSFDSSGIEIETTFKISIDSSRKKLSILPDWRYNSVYTVRLLKGFARDMNQETTMPSKYIFRTKSDEDYGKLDINLPKKYVAKNFLLQVNKDKEVVYLEALSKAKVSLQLLAAGTYTLILIEDQNGDGEWTTGELKSKRQPEKVFPYTNSIIMKAGWEHIVDFEKEQQKK